MIDRRWMYFKILQAAGVCLLVVLACHFLYRYDNKYASSGPYGMNGVLILSEPDIKKYTFLTDGWAVYAGALLTPDNFSNGAPSPDAYVFIGQLGGFEQLTGSPHGSVTYRLVIGVPDKPLGYMLALPEIYSSCRVYINGVEHLVIGEPNPDFYHFETGESIVTFEAAGVIDLLIAVSDFSHLYSGMVYPPVLGASDAVSRLLETRLVIRTTALTAALIIGVVSLFIGLLSKRRGFAAMYGLICLLFIIYACYPVAMTLMHGSPWFYALEQASFCAMLLVITLLQIRIYPITGRLRIIRLFIIGLGAFTCLTALVMPLILPSANLSLMMAYSNLIMTYEWLTAGYITVIAGLSVWEKKTESMPLFIGMLCMDVSLIMDRILHNYEPILSGWFPEWGSFVLILSVGVTTTREIVRQYNENMLMEERVRGIIASGREHYQTMNEMYDTLRILRHDYKYHLSAIRELLHAGQQDNADRYLVDVETQLSAGEIQVFCKNSVINALLASYAERLSKLKIRFTFEISLPESISVPDYDLCIILGNLLENAVEACQKQIKNRCIELVVKSHGTQLAIMVKNSFDGAVRQDKNRLVSTKKEGGIGLRSIQMITARYGGELFTEWNTETFTAYVLMHL